MKKPRNAKKILDLLEERWKHEADLPALLPLFEEPLDDLILTLLSQNTNDINRDKAYDRLRAEFPTWEEVAAAPAKEIRECIKVAGLGETKSERMKIVLGAVKEKFGTYSIKELRKWQPEEIREFLVSLPGIGVKTAGVVMVFDLGKPAFPVDTHLSRISKRLGWAEEKTAPDKIQEYLEATLPEERFGGAHLNLIEHGRHICSAKNPKCEECPVKKYCIYIKTLDGKK